MAVGEFSSEDIERLKICWGPLRSLPDQVSGRKIGLAKERIGLYYLEPSLIARNDLSLSFFSSSNKDAIWLYHLRVARISTSESPVLAETFLVPNNPDPVVESSPIPTSVPHDFPRFSQVYSRRKAIPDSTQVQESNSDPGIETTVRSDFPHQPQPAEIPTNPTNLDLPIALRKRTRECTKRPLYPLFHYVSLNRLSPTHKNSL
ncbi:hypothetical protein HPP92_009346 [Vanilla planifolia]|uniref:Uncharacterized protein n=1 Tax=Vanilla planifolia TaxID=51239 RepID=A0A835RFI2_VANPL|nr:hypothetical protein HPP92_009346 [Vanilla planifolia]